MYFPYLRGRQFELIALRELLESERIGQEIIPIIEPVKPSATLLKTLECFVNHDREIAVVFNPAVGDFPKKINEMRRENSKIANELYELLTKHNKIIKSYIMSAKSAVKLKTDELKTERLIINPDRDCLDDFLEVYDKSLPRYTLIPDDRAFRRVISESKVLFEDNFNKRSRNIDYIEHEDEFFSDSHLYFQNENYVGFESGITRLKALSSGINVNRGNVSSYASKKSSKQSLFKFIIRYLFLDASLFISE